MRNLLISLFASMVVSLSLAGSAMACSCMQGGPPCQAYLNTPVVFSGRVLEVETVRVQTDPRGYGYERRIVRIAIEDAFRGVQAGTVEVHTGQGGGDCGYNFEQGRSYLVYASKGDNGQISAGICSRTRPIEDAAEDLEYIRGLDKMAPTARLSGVITRYKPRRSNDEWTKPQPLAGLPVSLSNARSTFETKTNDEGAFRFDDVPPGDFKLTALAPPGYWPGDGDQKVTLKARACLVTGFSFELDSSVSGRVTKPGGSPASATMVNLIPVDQVNADYQPDPHYAETDGDGRFVIRGLTPGSYYLGVRLLRITDSSFPWPRTFYPGVKKLEDAAIITVTDGQPQGGLEFQLPEPLKTRRIEGIVVMADGKPAKNFSVFTKEIEHARGGMGDGMGVEIASDGKFVLTRPDGIAYAVYAYVNLPDGKQMHAEPIEVRSKGAQKGLKLTVDRPDGSCAKCRR